MNLENKPTCDDRTIIMEQTIQNNIDNISRTKAYQNFYYEHPEIKWAFLASMVSRNAGWNMTDLQNEPFSTMLHQHQKDELFSTYERANWLIFSDAYPQLYIYSLSKKRGTSMFHLLSTFNVSTFMKMEWERFWHTKDQNRLVTALIINEQNVIQHPVILEPFYKRHVFHGLPYLSQDFFHLSAVLFPTLTGKVYGSYVHDFSNLTKRIKLGKKLAALLFHPDYYESFLAFSRFVEPTGSRYEYEKFFSEKMPKYPMLRSLYPVISHQDNIRREWYVSRRSIRKKWWKEEVPDLNQDVSHKFYAKRNFIKAYHNIREISTNGQ